MISMYWKYDVFGFSIFACPFALFCERITFIPNIVANTHCRYQGTVQSGNFLEQERTKIITKNWHDSSIGVEGSQLKKLFLNCASMFYNVIFLLSDQSKRFKNIKMKSTFILCEESMPSGLCRSILQQSLAVYFTQV